MSGPYSGNLVRLWLPTGNEERTDYRGNLSKVEHRLVAEHVVCLIVSLEAAEKATLGADATEPMARIYFRNGATDKGHLTHRTLAQDEATGEVWAFLGRPSFFSRHGEVPVRTPIAIPASLKDG